MSNDKFQIPNSKSQTKSKIQIPNYKKILIVRLDRIGDVLLSTPVIKALRDSYPESHIAFMVRPYARDIVEGNPYLDEVIIYDKAGSEKGIMGTIRFAKKLKSMKFDVVIILHPTSRTNLVVFLAGIPQRIGFDRKWGVLLSKKISHTKQFGLKHEIDYTLGILSCIGIEARDRSLYMPIKRSSEEGVAAIFRESGIGMDDIVVTINPGASCPSKRWRAEKFAGVANGLIEKYKAKIVIISDKKDKVFGDKMASLVKAECLNLCGDTTISDIASVLRRSNLLISNDSGPVHIACAVDTPVISIFGRSDRGLSPQRWGPSGDKSVVLHRDVGCDICLAHNCKNGFKCLESIAISDVVEAADKLLGE